MEELVSFFVTVVIDIAWLTKGVFFCIIYLFEVFLELAVFFFDFTSNVIIYAVLVLTTILQLLINGVKIVLNLCLLVLQYTIIFTINCVEFIFSNTVYILSMLYSIVSYSVDYITMPLTYCIVGIMLWLLMYMLLILVRWAYFHIRRVRRDIAISEDQREIQNSGSPLGQREARRMRQARRRLKDFHNRNYQIPIVWEEMDLSEDDGEQKMRRRRDRYRSRWNEEMATLPLFLNVPRQMYRRYPASAYSSFSDGSPVDSSDYHMKVLELEKQLEKEQESKQCVVCLDRPRVLMIKPCNHYCLCEECGGRLKDCPICNRTIETMEKVFDV